MHASYPLEPTCEDSAALLKWKLRLALVYGAVLIACVVFAAMRPQEHIAHETTKAPAISVWEIHNLAHLENLPVEQFNDQSLEFAQAQR